MPNEMPSYFITVNGPVEGGVQNVPGCVPKSEDGVTGEAKKMAIKLLSTANNWKDLTPEQQEIQINKFLGTIRNVHKES